MINTGDAAFILVCAAMVCFMTPALAIFYAGLLRKNNVIDIMTQSFIAIGVVTPLWMLCGFSLAFAPSVGGVIGNLQYAFLNGVGAEPNAGYAETIPFILFFGFQIMFAIITPALVSGTIAERTTLKSYVLFLIFWSLLVYVPMPLGMGRRIFGLAGPGRFCRGNGCPYECGLFRFGSCFCAGKPEKAGLYPAQHGVCCSGRGHLVVRLAGL